MVFLFFLMTSLGSIGIYFDSLQGFVQIFQDFHSCVSGVCCQQ